MSQTQQLSEVMTESRPRVPDPAEDGVVSFDAENRPVITFTRHLRHSVERVWRALTEPEEVKQWLDGGLAIDARLGGRIELAPEGTGLGRGEIVRYEPPHVLEYWIEVVRENAPNNVHLMRYELEAEGDGCVLYFSNTFDKGETRVPNSVACGWHAYLELFDDFLEGRPIDRSQAVRRERIVELYWHYRDKPREA